MAGFHEDLDANSLMSGASVLTRSADEFENDQSIEAMWAIKAFDHSEVYFNLLCAVDPKLLRLTPHDDEIYAEFRRMFPDMNIKCFQEEELKNENAKAVWREFCEKFKHIEDYSFGTLIRLDCEGLYNEKNSCLVVRVQFLAIETARNREGYNTSIYERYKDKKQMD